VLPFSRDGIRFLTYGLSSMVNFSSLRVPFCYGSFSAAESPSLNRSDDTDALFFSDVQKKSNFVWKLWGFFSKDLLVLG